MNDKRVEASAWLIGCVLNYECGGDWDKLNDFAKTHYTRVAKSALELADAAAWQPIETAPRDGTSILTWGSAGSHSVCETRYLVVGPYIHCVNGARFQKEPGWYWSGWDGAVGPVPEPTHWQPLPAPPSDATP